MRKKLCIPYGNRFSATVSALWSGHALWVLSLLALLMFGSSARSEDKQIVWIVANWPPVHMLVNGATPLTPQQLGDGILDRIMAEIIERLPDYHHSFLQANMARAWAEIGTGKNLCFAGAFKSTEREKIAYFAPDMLWPDIAMVVRHDRQSDLQLQVPSITLSHLAVERKDLLGYIETGRSYSPSLDDVLRHAGGNVHRVVVPEPGHLLRLLDAGRMDYTLEYPMVVEYQSQLSPFKYPLEMIPLTEAPALSTGYVACTRNAWGKEVIREIEVALQDAAGSPSYRDAVSKWLPALLVKQHRAQLDAFYESLANPLHASFAQ